jgi:hypothetical protein
MQAAKKCINFEIVRRRGQFFKRRRVVIPACIVALSLVVAVLSGCRRTFDESRAVKLTQAVIDAKKDPVVVSIAPIAGTMNREFTDPTIPAELQRPVQGGLIQQRRTLLKYPNLSGHFLGKYFDTPDVTIQIPHEAILALQLVSNSKPPRIEGTSEMCSLTYDFGPPPRTNRTCGTWHVSGVLNANGPTDLTESTEPNTHIILTLTRGNPDVLTGVIRTQYYSRPVRFEGKAGGPDLEQPIYTYDWSDKLPKDALISAYQVNAGHLIVDVCGQLLLQGDTSATATCSGHADMLSAVKMILGDSVRTIQVHAVYGKRPDGEWVGTAASYAAPSM